MHVLTTARPRSTRWSAPPSSDPMECHAWAGHGEGCRAADFRWPLTAVLVLTRKENPAMSEESDWEAGAWQAVRRDWERDIIAAFEGEDQDGDEGDPFPVSAGVRGSGDTA